MVLSEWGLFFVPLAIVLDSLSTGILAVVGAIGGGVGGYRITIKHATYEEEIALN